MAPEFQLVNESSVAGYLNFMQGVIDSGIGGATCLVAAYTAEIALAESPTAASPSSLVNRINLLLCAGQLSTATVTTITTAVGSMAGTVASNVLAVDCSGSNCGALSANTYSGTGVGAWRFVNPDNAPAILNINMLKFYKEGHI